MPHLVYIYIPALMIRRGSGEKSPCAKFRSVNDTSLMTSSGDSQTINTITIVMRTTVAFLSLPPTGDVKPVVTESDVIVIQQRSCHFFEAMCDVKLSDVKLIKCYNIGSILATYYTCIILVTLVASLLHIIHVAFLLHGLHSCYMRTIFAT